MTSHLGPSWKPRLAGILTVLFTPLAYWLLGFTDIDQGTKDALVGGLATLLISCGLMTAKSHDVSNAPLPLATAQPVADAQAKMVPTESVVQKPAPSKPHAPQSPHVE